MDSITQKNPGSDISVRARGREAEVFQSVEANLSGDQIRCMRDPERVEIAAELLWRNLVDPSQSGGKDTDRLSYARLDTANLPQLDVHW
jgi:hypothetical protein